MFVLYLHSSYSTLMRQQLQDHCVHTAGTLLPYCAPHVEESLHDEQTVHGVDGSTTSQHGPASDLFTMWDADKFIGDDIIVECVVIMIH